MKSKKMSALGIYRTSAEADRAVEELKLDGFTSADISVLLPDSTGSLNFAHTKGSKAPEGGATGAVVGGALGLLVGIGALAIPGVGPFIAAGPIVAAMAGAGIGGAIGGIAGALIGFGIPEYEAKRYEGIVMKGGILLSVHADTSEEVIEAKNCLERTGAKDISSTGEAKPYRRFSSNQEKNIDSVL